MAYLALFVALSGTAVASGVLNKKKVNNIITNRAAGLSVAHAKDADNAKNADKLGGVAPGGYQLRVAGSCATGLTISAIAADGSVSCAAGEPGFARISGTTATGRGVSSVSHTNGTATWCITPSFTAHVAVATVDAGPGTPASAEVQIPGGPAGVGCSANQIGVVLAPAPGANDLPFFILFE